MFKGKIGVSKGFQTSINIAYDLNNNEKIKSFIPTTTAIDIIEDVLLSTDSTSLDRARILIGAYGKGKSHIILVLMSLLFKKEVALFDVLLNKIKEQNEELYQYAINYLQSDMKLLPIVISGSSTSLAQSFLNALQQTLRSENINDIMPDTHFKASINMIKRWKEEYIETYNRFVDALNEPIDNFLFSLSEYNVSAYDKFEKLYPSLTSGSAFNPFIGFDVVELYEKVVEKLKDKGYGGVYIIYDEFSKYLESSITKATVSDIKMLQDFAEKCNRSYNNQMHLMLISHKDISNYIDKLPKQKVDGWKGVSERFKHITLQNNFSQIYEIISSVINKDFEFWNGFCENNKNRFFDLTDRFKANGILDKNDEITANIATMGCYPLHPISTFILPRLSEKVAQNERTLFTFLSSENKFTLSTFLNGEDSEFPILTPDYIYDYFEPLFRKEIYTSEAHKLFKLTTNIMLKLDNNSLQAKIIKTIALIYMVEQFEKLPPTTNIIVDAFRESTEDINEIHSALKDLRDRQFVIYVKRSNDYLKLKESSGIDIPTSIADTIEKIKNTITVKEILNKSNFDSYMYPTSYNDEMEITRYFNFTFIDSGEYFAVENWNKKIENINADGIIYGIIPANEEEIIALRNHIKLGELHHDRLVFILPKEYIDIERIAFEYYAVKLLRNAALSDDLLIDEYDIYIEDLEEVIGNFISYYSRPETNGAEYYFKGAIRPIYRKAQISALLSEICENTYPMTPLINNESINKDVLPTVAINSRSKLIAGLLENELEINLGLTGTGQDVSIMRSTLIRTGVLTNEAKAPLIDLNPADVNIRNMLTQISLFFAGANSTIGQNFKDLYDILTLPIHHIGLKKGVIPIYIAVVLHGFKKYAVIKYKSDEVKITTELLNSINENPEAYRVFLEDWNQEKAEFISRLADIFSDYVIDKEKDYNTFSYIVFAMCRWYMGLPKYTKEMRKIYYGFEDKPLYRPIDTSYINLINSLKQPNINAREYLFEKLLEIYGLQEFTVDIVNNIFHTKELYDNAKANLVDSLIKDVKYVMNRTRSIGESLSSVIKDWYEELNNNTKNHLYLNNEEKVLQLMATIGNDERTFIERLAKCVSGLRLDDWKAETIELFLDDLMKFKSNVEEYNKNVSEEKECSITDMYKISFADKNGNEVVKTFSKMEYSATAKLLLSEISNALEEMGRSISEYEKRQVLMELLEKMC